MANPRYLYKVYEGKKLIAKGDSFDLGDKFGVNPQTIKNAALYNKLLLHQYTVKQSGFIKAKPKVLPKKKAKPIKKTKKELTLEYLLHNLDIYDNTILVCKDPDTYVKLLKEKGIDVTYRRSIYGKHYVIEKLNKENYDENKD